jgi:Fe-S-cluster-containing dehydrogenase component
VKYSCMHCQKPSCVSVCPVAAMVKDKITGIVDYKKDACIGCRYCQVACAFNIPKFQWEKAIPQIVKCDLCKNTNLKQKGTSAVPRFAPPVRSCLASARSCWPRPGSGWQTIPSSMSTISTVNMNWVAPTTSIWQPCRSRSWGCLN